jgi:hypothetical protein
MRTEFSNLISFKYKNLINNYNFNFKNPGFLNTFQFINCEDYLNQGESTPKFNPYFFQNLGEAEFVGKLILPYF